MFLNKIITKNVGKNAYANPDIAGIPIKISPALTDRFGCGITALNLFDMSNAYHSAPNINVISMPTTTEIKQYSKNGKLKLSSNP